MNFFELVRLAAVNLWRRPLRTFLTVLGVIIGTLCITIMVALGLGNLEQFNESIMQNSNLTRIEVSANYGSNVRLDQAAVDRFRQIPGVASATGVSNLPAYITMGRYEYTGSICAVDPAAMEFEFGQGKVFSQSDTLEFVIGSNAREYFEDPRDRTGYGMYSYGVAVAVDTSADGGAAAEIGPDVDWLEESLT